MKAETPRVQPLTLEEFRSLSWTQFGENVPESQEIKNVTLTWARHPALMESQKSYQRYLHAGSLLPRKDQEIVILRIAWLCRSEYAFGQHTLYGMKAGLTDSDISRVVEGSAAEGWTEFESALLRAVDELHEEHIISEATWCALSDRYDIRQLMDLLVIVGRYWTMSVMLNTLGVQREEGTPAFPYRGQ